MARRRSAQSINDIVAHLNGVTDAVHHTATQIGIQAEAKLELHRDTGRAEIVVSRGDVDSFVSLVDEAAAAIEFGHWHNKSGRWVDGLYIIRGAARRF